MEKNRTTQKLEELKERLEVVDWFWWMVVAVWAVLIYLAYSEHGFSAIKGIGGAFLSVIAATVISFVVFFGSLYLMFLVSHRIKRENKALNISFFFIALGMTYISYKITYGLLIG